MSSLSPVIRELFSSLRLSPTVAGQLDWVAGIYRVNRTVGEWRAYFADPKTDLDLTMTLSHEMHHFMQISSLSYLHRFASLMYYTVADVVRDCYNDMSALPDTLYMNDTLRDDVWDLQWRAPDGVSVIDIVESLTYFVEVNTERPRRTSEYAAELEASDDVPPEYKRAYLHAFELSGGNGDMGALFEIMCHVSLCSGAPRDCFSMLAESVRSGAVNANMTLADIVAYCERNDTHYMGFAWEWRESLGSDFPQHPTFGPLKNALADEGTWESFVRYMISPHKSLDPFINLALAPPILFNPYPGRDPGFDEWPLDVGRALRGATPDEKRKHGMWCLYMASASRKYFDAFGTPPSTVYPILRGPTP